MGGDNNNRMEVEAPHEMIARLVSRRNPGGGLQPEKTTTEQLLYLEEKDHQQRTLLQVTQARGPILPRGR